MDVRIEEVIPGQDSVHISGDIIQYSATSLVHDQQF